jgi:DNA-directed RNA polymerase subunit delta
MEKQNSEIEVAYKILGEIGQPMYFRELITQVLEIKGRHSNSPAYAMAEVHTQINMDSRFVHKGKGMWGLAEWEGHSTARAAAAEETAAGSETGAKDTSRRSKLFEEIQQEYVDGAGMDDKGKS